MEKKDSVSQQQRRLKIKNEEWKPYIRYEKETDSWIAKAIRIDRGRNERMEETMGEIPSKIKILMNREDLDIIARIIAYMYHDKKDEYLEISTDLRKEHIYKDLRSIDQWLNIQYKKMENQDEQPK